LEDRLLKELMEFYEVTDYRDLALALARDHVPGFQVALPKGRKKGNPKELLLLFLRVKTLLESGVATSVLHA